MQKAGWSSTAPSQFPQDQSPEPQHGVKTARPVTTLPVVNYPEQQYPEQGNTMRVKRRVAEDPPVNPNIESPRDEHCYNCHKNEWVNGNFLVQVTVTPSGHNAEEKSGRDRREDSSNKRRIWGSKKTHIQTAMTDQYGELLHQSQKG